MKRLILFLIRKRLGVRKYQQFQFTNQHNKTITYYFENDKLTRHYLSGQTEPSNVSLNWLLNDLCEITIF